MKVFLCFRVLSQGSLWLFSATLRVSPYARRSAEKIAREPCGKKGKHVKTFIDRMASDEEDFEEEEADTKETRVAKPHACGLSTRDCRLKRTLLTTDTCLQSQHFSTFVVASQIAGLTDRLANPEWSS